MMKLYFSPAVKPDGASCASAVHNNHGKKLLENGYFNVMCNSGHRLRSEEILREDDTLECAGNPVRI